MVSLFDKASQATKDPKSKMTIGHQEFLKRIKKTFYYGPSNPNRMISQPLANHVAETFNFEHRNYDLHTLDLTTISRIRQQTPCTMILSIIYLERLIKTDPNYVKSITPSELFLVSMMVSAKFYSDYDETEIFASTWANEADITVERIKQLEISFLNAIQWNLLVSKHEFYEKLKTVEKILALKEGLARSTFTYTEMDLLLPTIEIAKQIINYTTVLMFTYACSIVAIALSSIILSIPLPLKTDVATCGGKNITADVSLSTALLLPNVIPSDDVPTECTFDELLETNAERSCNVTVDFSIFNTLLDFGVHAKRNYQQVNDFGFFSKFNPVSVVW